jgi:hypothetical protein
MLHVVLGVVRCPEGHWGTRGNSMIQILVQSCSMIVQVKVKVPNLILNLNCRLAGISILKFEQRNV